MTDASPRILLIVGGGIAAYKACELVRVIRKDGGAVTCVLTAGGARFVTGMTLAALSENPVHTTLWDLKDEAEMGHIRLSREADLVVICPATADLLAKMAAGIADDLATTLLLATDKPVMAVPAMNVRMWQHPATMRNVDRLRADGVTVLEPDAGPMACGEFGPGRLPEPEAVWAAIQRALGDYLPVRSAPLPGESEDDGMGSLSAGLIHRIAPPEIEFAEEEPDPELASVALTEPEPELLPESAASPLIAKKGKARPAPPTDPEALDLAAEPPAEVEAAENQPEPFATLGDNPPGRPLFGRHVLVTAGPTHEPIDPVRYIANRSSGKQGFAIAAAAAAAGARVTLVTGPVALTTPDGCRRVDVESAREMAEAVEKALPADAAVMVAAVADWRSEDLAAEKIKKRGSAPPVLRLTENPDILATVACMRQRPRLLIGFAAETQEVLDHAKEKRVRKGADWIVANDVSGPPGESVMGGDHNLVHLITAKGVETWEHLPKELVARRLVERIAVALDGDGAAP